MLGITPFGVHITPLSSPGGVPFPFSLQPSISPDCNGASDNGGTEYFVSTYDDFSLANNKVSVWAMTDTDTLNAEVGIPGFTTLAVNTESFTLPVFASQKPGPIPLGKSMGQPEGTLNPDDERMQQVVFADGHLWSSVSTALQVGANTLDGAAYFVIKPSWPNGVLKASVTRQGYVATANNNLLYPAIGVSENGNGAMVFTLTGPDYFPSAAYIPITLSGGVAADIRLAAAGTIGRWVHLLSLGRRPSGTMGGLFGCGGGWDRQGLDRNGIYLEEETRQVHQLGHIHWGAAASVRTAGV